MFKGILRSFLVILAISPGRATDLTILSETEKSRPRNASLKVRELQNLSKFLEERKIECQNYSVNMLLPKDYEIDPELMEGSVQYAREFHKNVEETLKESIARDLEDNFWMGVVNKNPLKAMLYLFTMIKGDIFKFTAMKDGDSVYDGSSFFTFSQTGVDVEDIKGIAGADSIEDEKAKKTMEKLISLEIGSLSQEDEEL